MLLCLVVVVVVVIHLALHWVHRSIGGRGGALSAFIVFLSGLRDSLQKKLWQQKNPKRKRPTRIKNVLSRTRRDDEEEEDEEEHAEEVGVGAVRC